jgi:poly-gamma-glutamate synthesis protein (capsule biosynthesis protein)
MRLVEPTGTVWGRIAALGDVAVLGAVRARARRDGPDAPFARVAPALRAADAGFANLESPVGEPALVRPGRSPEFWQEPGVPAALVRAGVRVVSLANNHMMDCGEEGLRRTLDACGEAGLPTIGAGADLAAARRPAHLEVGGRRTAWLAYGAPGRDAAGPARPGIAPLEPALVREDVAEARRGADVVVVSVHWGSMYVDYPPPRVLEAARVLGEAGAGVVLGHHPHVLQGARRERRTLVLYSLGDAVFDPRAGELHARVAEATRPETAVFTVELADEHGVSVEPLRLDDDGVPASPEASRAQAQFERLAALSAGLVEAERRFATEGASTLLRYELQSLGAWVRQGRWDRVLRLVGSVRPRHVPLLLNALRRRGGA